jgi:hypothetical protein
MTEASPQPSAGSAFPAPSLGRVYVSTFMVKRSNERVRSRVRALSRMADLEERLA